MPAEAVLVIRLKTTGWGQLYSQTLKFILVIPRGLVVLIIRFL